MIEEVANRRAQIESIVLTDEETKEAIFRYKLGKWNKARNKYYWDRLDAIKGETVQLNQRA